LHKLLGKIPEELVYTPCGLSLENNARQQILPTLLGRFGIFLFPYDMGCHRKMLNYLTKKISLRKRRMEGGIMKLWRG
jgi:hypothetical protein